MSDNVTDEFFELNLNDIKLLHADNIKKAREAEEGAQVSYAGTDKNFTKYLISRFLPINGRKFTNVKLSSKVKVD